ncbi:helix-turn-helix domain-containing protein [Parvibaculum sp.]|jgi:transcriptional regulator with XRE-family HTH domain|uniref:helix-turn-helix domain-containing protein n=1 Tax=Parvibaculum sp. TaxID=2024848 RepID=UPI001B2B8408|nr:helix-turn-helix domain-containing protein [Parvibaculum sp.]MBO6634660.1 helix-turn-helix transcriptional regulator [Parvibaculum sp.]MBO6677478.1 helix-turn-helix transcriptional regulator [Parvibaculum sp.]MBO6685065.1 helix-turn-helix transcriptional regulator [Parvibaculum sp.]MBO6903440.1 helix-turn-helix transcriptional regulator [Parvibaculum sp.]
MTPFGRRLRELRRERGVTMKEMAAALRVTPAYLSALEHGRRGKPSWRLVQAIIGYFNVIWDEAEELERLARISHPRVVIDTAGLAPQATEAANRLAEEISDMSSAEIAKLLALLDGRKRRRGT